MVAGGKPDQDEARRAAGPVAAYPDMLEPPGACIWCETPFAASAIRLRGRIRCPSCGAATTDPWPDAGALEEAYSRYRPHSGRFSGIGDAVLRRTRGRLARRISRLAPPGPVLDVGAGDGTLVDALERRGRDALGLERDSRHPRVREAEITEVEGQWSAIVFWHSLEHLSTPGHDIDQRGTTARARRHPVGGGAQQRQSAGAGVPRPLAAPRPASPSRTSARRPRSPIASSSWGLELTRVSHWRGGQVVFGWLQGLVGCAPGTPGPLRRNPQA